ncbi:hypothetical protein HOF56_01325 [Candidatus Peribacteria bacterium]|jgi:sporulation protein YlmC with PRC-barrel domain|nr:hypothetical protein [Candidatus Peribacteria bacterium]MBT4020805.1 hypothetical protein [Candidatus Peribacteria bacterium]MBT4241015.1 hypothetical protein [Candidatus Peribacteria bacterium]MBT4474487.1 hypothetical protein [Candidatus Peribacteria bacterium]
MHLLYSDTIGTEIIDDIDHQIQGKVADILIEPDRGKIIALLVVIPGTSEIYALQTQDISSWGNRVHICDSDVLGPATDFVRLQDILNDPRTVIGQKIKTESGFLVGKCIDLQFEVTTFMIEWIFPRKFFFRKLSLPASDILEITENEILVKDQTPEVEEIVEDEITDSGNVQNVTEPAVGRSLRGNLDSNRD